jgi:putative FmdB family regulatory protein
MPIYEYKCLDCGKVSEILVFSSGPEVSCPECGSLSMEKLMSATSSLTGKSGTGRLPGPGDTACCGSRPGEAAGCAGPGSCCGKIG